jgi:outer membrane protein
MIKNLLVFGLLFVVGQLAFFFILNKLDNKDVYYVDSPKLVDEYKGMQSARKAYQEKAVKWKANVDTLAAEVQNEIRKFEKGSKSMSAKERNLSQELINLKQKQLYEYQQAINRQAKEEDDKMTAEVLTQINNYIKKYGAEKGYKIVLGTANGNIVYADESLDITSEVLEGLNKEYKGQ